MVAQMQLMLSACIVYSALKFGQAYDQVVSDQASDEHDVQENLHNLFDSIANNNARKNDQYRGILRDEVTMEQRAFNSMNEQLRTSRSRNLRKNRIAKVAESMKARKREVYPVQEKREYEEEDWRKLEQWYVELNPKLWALKWARADKLTAEQHRRICDDVLKVIIPSTHNFSDCVYIPPEPNKIQAQRVLKFAPLKLEVRLVHITIVKCIYEEVDFFLTHGNDSHVFEVHNHRFDADYEEVWYLKTGLHRVHYD